jgi:prepilin signal peptidase PulO-like enzyme (type II secretory pathway)
MKHLLSTVVIAGGDLKHYLWLLAVLVVVELVLGIVYYLVKIAPFVNVIVKEVILWLIIALMAFVLIDVLLSLIGYPIIIIR